MHTIQNGCPQRSGFGPLLWIKIVKLILTEVEEHGFKLYASSGGSTYILFWTYAHSYGFKGEIRATQDWSVAEITTSTINREQFPNYMLHRKHNFSRLFPLATYTHTELRRIHRWLTNWRGILHHERDLRSSSLFLQT